MSAPWVPVVGMTLFTAWVIHVVVCAFRGPGIGTAALLGIVVPPALLALAAIVFMWVVILESCWRLR